MLERLASQGPGVLLPASDRAVEFVSQQRESIPPELRSFESPTSAHLKLMDKASLYSIAAEAGLRTPVVQRLSSRAEIDDVAARAAYPSLLKPVHSHVYRELFGAHRNILVQDPDQLRAAAGPALDAGLDWLVTEYIPGPETSLEGAVTVRLADGSVALSYTRCKLRQHPPVLRRRLGAGDGACAGGDGDGPEAARHRGLRRHLQPGGQASRGDGRARPDGDQRPHPAEHRPRGGRRRRSVLAHLRNARRHPARHTAPAAQQRARDRSHPRGTGRGRLRAGGDPDAAPDPAVVRSCAQCERTEPERPRPGRRLRGRSWIGRRSVDRAQVPSLEQGRSRGRVEARARTGPS